MYDDERISASKITHFLRGNITPRDDTARGWVNEKTMWEEAIEHNSRVVTPLHRRVNLAPAIWSTASIHELMRSTVDGNRVLDVDSAVTLHDGSVVPLNKIHQFTIEQLVLKSC